MNNLVQGLEVSALGIFVTFFALGVFILIMIVLQRLFPGESEASGEVEQTHLEEAPVVAEMAESEDEGEVIAAIAAALSFLRSQNQSNLGGSLEEGRSGWWASHRLEARVGKVEKR